MKLESESKAIPKRLTGNFFLKKLTINNPKTKFIYFNNLLSHFGFCSISHNFSISYRRTLDVCLLERVQSYDMYNALYPMQYY